MGMTFSESWHRVANLSVSIRPTVEIRKQFFRGETWFVLCDTFNNQFLRVRPEAYDFIARLSQNSTVEEVWETCLEKNPETAPGQEDVIRLLSRLHFASLLSYEGAGGSAKIFDRFDKRRGKEARSKLMSILFMRIPLFDPDPILARITRVVRFFTGWAGLSLWIIVCGFGIKAVIDNAHLLGHQAQGVLAPGNLFLLYGGLVLVKTLHEFGHAAVCRRFGGEVHTMGLMLLVFTPLPYVDATSSWRLRSHWKRAFVGAAGMLVEMFLAAIAAIVWAKTGEGAVNSLAYNIMFVASVSTVLFNINPLLRFDGYYILSDLLDVPNLHERSRKQLRFIAERYLFGADGVTNPASDLKEAFWFTLFGILSGLYRGVVMVGILFFVADRFLLAGAIMALLCLVKGVVLPPLRLIRYLFTSPALARVRSRAIVLCTLMFAVPLIFMASAPFPDRFRAPGVLETKTHTQVINEVSGWMVEILATPGSVVNIGDPLIRFESHELFADIEKTRFQMLEIEVMEQRADSRYGIDLAPVRKRKKVVASRLADLLEKKENLTLRAAQKGIWVSPNLKTLKGVWLSRGTAMGELVDPDAFRFSAVVNQDEASKLFGKPIENAEIRFSGQADINVPVTELKIIPFRNDRLPAASLGWLGGGEIPVSLTDESGLTASQPFFLIHADPQVTPGALFLHGRSGKLRITLEPKPLLFQWVRKLRQLLQKRYQL